MERNIFLAALVLGLVATPPFSVALRDGPVDNNDPVQVWLAQLHSSDPLVRRRSRRCPDSLQLDRQSAATILVNEFDSGDAFVRRYIADAIGEISLEPSRTVPLLVNALTDSDRAVRNHAAIALIKIGKPAIPALSAVVQVDPHYVDPTLTDAIEVTDIVPSQQAYAAYILARIGPESVRGVLSKPLAPDDLNLYQTFVLNRQAQAAGEAYLEMLHSQDADTEWIGLQGLLDYEGGSAAVPELVNLLENGKDNFREQAAKVLAWTGPPAADAVPALISAVDNPEAEVRDNAIGALGRIHSKPEVSVPALIRMFQRFKEANDPENLNFVILALREFRKQGTIACPYIRSEIGVPNIEQADVFSAVASVCRADPETVRLVRSQVHSGKNSTFAIITLVRIGPDAVPALIDLFRHANLTLQIKMMTAINDLDERFPYIVPLLIDALATPSAAVQRKAALELANIGPDAAAAVPELVHQYSAGRNRVAIQCSFVGIGSSASLALPQLSNVAADATLVAMIKKEAEGRRLESCDVDQAFISIGSASAPFLVKLLANPSFAESALNDLLEIGVMPDDAAPLVGRLLQSGSGGKAAEYLARSGPKGMTELTTALKSRDPGLRNLAVYTFFHAKSCAEKLTAIEPFIHDSNAEVRSTAGMRIKDCAGGEELIAQLRNDPDLSVRNAFAKNEQGSDPFDEFVHADHDQRGSSMFEQLDDRGKSYIPALEELLGSPDELLASDAATVLSELSPGEDSEEYRALTLESFIALHMFDEMIVVQRATDLSKWARAGRPNNSLPDLPWPVPKPSRLDLIRKPLFGPNVKSLGDVFEQLQSALRKAGITETGLFAAPGGFAIVTPVERIHGEDMTPFPEPDRWTSGKLPLSEFSLGSYLQSLFLDRPGQFRLFIFLITDRNPQISAAEMTESEARNLAARGGRTLPDSIANGSFAQAECYVLLYHFERKIGGDAAELSPSPFAIRTHLLRLGLTQFAQE